MAANKDPIRHYSTLNFIYPKNRDALVKSGYTWLDDKRLDDGAEGLWRVHNSLYDLTNFVDKHPGGTTWLTNTQGTDVTEAFECHHLSNKPQEILKDYFVRSAKTPRNSPFTFEEDGFYRTLKRNVNAVLPNIPKSRMYMAAVLADFLFIGTFVFAILANVYHSYVFGIMSGILLALNTISAHNYAHRKENFRMYYFDLSLMQSREWRITHNLSHHLFPNTILDCEISFYEPILEYLPKKKSVLVKYGSKYCFILVLSGLSLVAYSKRVFQYFYVGDKRAQHWCDLIPFTLPVVMCLTTTVPIIETLKMWIFITIVGSTWFHGVAFNAAHHHPDIFHDGDTPRSKDTIDWGIYQLDTVGDRKDINASLFLILTNFGDHALHHMFPTLDQGTLTYLYPVFNETMQQFGLSLRTSSQLDLVKGQFKQLVRETSNPYPPKHK